MFFFEKSWKSPGINEANALESPGFSINFFCGNPVLADIDIYVNILAFAIFCPWGMKMTIKKKLTAGNYCTSCIKYCSSSCSKLSRFD